MKIVPGATKPLSAKEALKLAQQPEKPSEVILAEIHNRAEMGEEFAYFNRDLLPQKQVIEFQKLGYRVDWLSDFRNGGSWKIAWGD